MKKGLFHSIKTQPFFVCLLPIFFVLHGCAENFGFVPLADALLLIAIYLSVSILFFGLFWLVYRNFAKAALVAFFIMCFHFFFGTVHDGLKKLFPGTFLGKYSFVLPAACILLVLLLLLVHKMKKSSLVVFTTYLNSLLLLLIIIDGGIMIEKFFANKNIPPSSDEFTKCDTCAKPDVYFILADEYAGHDELKNVFHYDNSSFENELKNREFRVMDHSHSNYNLTPFSVASILNMDYIPLTDSLRSGSNLAHSYQWIKNSTVLHFFQANGYQFYNYSVFDFEHKPAPVRETFLPVKTQLITSQTFLSRLQRDLWFKTVTIFKSKKSIRDVTYYNNVNNKRLYRLTWEIAGERTAQPKFVYTHLMMPHYPYYYDKNGTELPFERVVEGNQVHKNDYVGYLQYTNRKILDLVDHIQKSSPAPPIIILMGDHGFRHFVVPVDRKYYFMNLSAVHFPHADYTTITDSMPAVNLFRAILNSQFQQHLPILKDSTIYLRD